MPQRTFCYSRNRPSQLTPYTFPQMSAQLTLDSIPLDAIIIEDRLRQDLGDLSMFDSIREVGLLQPVVVHLEQDGKIRLIAGGRRCAALRELGYDMLYHGATADPLRPGFVFAQELSEDIRLELEVTENVARHPMNWKEICLSIFRIHELRCRTQKDGGNWVIAQTGALLGVSRASANNAIRVAKALLNDDKEIHSAANLSDAVKILLRRVQILAERKQQAFRDNAREQRKLEKLVIIKATSPNDLSPSSSSQDTPVVPELLRPVLDAKRQQALDAYETACTIVTECDSLRVGMPNLPAESVDHVYTDIPYGIDMDNVKINDIDVTSKEHDRDSNIRDFELFLRNSYRIIKPTGFCVFWFDIEHFTTLHEIATRVGFSCQRWPLHWHKSTAKNEVPRYNTTKNYESVMFCRKPNATLTKPVTSSIFTGQWEKDERARYMHPFAKPFEAHEKMLSLFATPGQTICDPYCGEGSGVLACLRKDLIVTAFDIVPDHVMRARNHIVELMCIK